jgi:tetratricopeptide (TPR) repeat protein
VCVALIVLTVAVFADIRSHEFVALDDPVYVTANPHVTGGLTWPNVSWAFTTNHAANWHPLTWLSHMLDVQLFGMNAGAHHLVSLLLHVANALLLFLLLLRMTAAPGRAAFVAALFAVHPLHVESVAWVAERKDLLSTLFWMLALLAYVEYVRASSNATRSPRARAAWYGLVVVTLALGLMAKPMLVTLPFVMLLLDLWPLARFSRATAARLILEKLPMFALVAASSIVTLIVQHQGGAMTAFQKYPPALLSQNALVSYATYIVDMVWPAGLAMFYPMPASIPAWKVAGAAILLAVVSLAAIRGVRRRPYVMVGWLWYLSTLVPVSGLVQVGLQARADRYTYIPLIGLFIIVAWGVPDLVARRRRTRPAVAVAACVAILACAVAAHAQVRYWQNSSVLWAHDIDVTRGVENARSRFNAAVQLSQQGRIDDAIAEFGNAVHLDPDFADAHYEMGLALAGQGRTAEAIPAFEATVRLKPNFAPGYLDLGVALLAADRPAEAAKVLTRAVQLDPLLAAAHHNLGLALATQGLIEESVGPFTEAVRLQPGLAEAQSDLGVALMRRGRLPGAIEHLFRAVQLRPDVAQTHANLGTAFAAAGRTGDAVREFREVLRIEPSNEEARRALASLAGQTPESRR